MRKRDLIRMVPLTELDVVPVDTFKERMAGDFMKSSPAQPFLRFANQISHQILDTSEIK